MLNLLSGARARFLLATFGPRGFRTVGCQQSHAEFVALKASLKSGLKSAVPFSERGCAGVSNPGVALADREKIRVDDVDVLRRRLTDAVQGGGHQRSTGLGAPDRAGLTCTKNLARKIFDSFNPIQTIKRTRYPPGGGAVKSLHDTGARTARAARRDFFSRHEIFRTSNPVEESKSRILSRTDDQRSRSNSQFISSTVFGRGRSKVWKVSIRDRRARDAHLFASFEGIFFAPEHLSLPRRE